MPLLKIDKEMEHMGADAWLISFVLVQTENKIMKLLIFCLSEFSFSEKSNRVILQI